MTDDIKCSTDNNISTFDKSIRVWLGLAMIVGSIQDGNLLPWSAVGLFLVASAWLGFCPLYASIGFRSAACKSI